MEKQRLSKWFFHFMALLAIFLLEAVVLPRLSFLPLRPLLLPLSVATIASLEGDTGGAGYGLFVGVLFFLFSPGAHGFSIFLFSLLGFLSALFSSLPQSHPFLRALLASFSSLLLLSLLQIIVFLLQYQDSLSALLPASALQLLLSLGCFPMIYAIHRLIRPHPFFSTSMPREGVS